MYINFINENQHRISPDFNAQNVFQPLEAFV